MARPISSRMGHIMRDGALSFGGLRETRRYSRLSALALILAVAACAPCPKCPGPEQPVPVTARYAQAEFGDLPGWTAGMPAQALRRAPGSAAVVACCSICMIERPICAMGATCRHKNLLHRQLHLPHHKIHALHV